MKKPLLALLLITSQSAVADKIPNSIDNLIAGYDTRTHVLEDGELTVRYNKQALMIDAAKSMFSAICDDYFMNKWNPETIKKITLWNVTSDQGYKINGGGIECKKTGSMDFKQAEEYRTSLIEKM
ncbi:hypothetical protein F3E40_16960 [Salmonella enterica subsp. enterica]|uniref:hypothetical protein n=1 Tax=Citrobacter freundii TaxID=546 RepID=UPI0012C98000|nr:hypothetical protein [Citrobacter freundii]EBG6828109.1 hypothetical protein [Salmonella enterica subsp. enterica]ECW0240692.1 hypothetical protein [Salmonella enterica subsp. enterica serovar Telhashomer]EDW6139029.1 hypothetical protein [Salmonella enterica subsp. enterica]MDV1800267.1 hypothetical protein [Citrobacter freundii]MDV1852402.1 hypothetical protein [Citrobacter freundii]